MRADEREGDRHQGILHTLSLDLVDDARIGKRAQVSQLVGLSRDNLAQHATHDLDVN